MFGRHIKLILLLFLIFIIFIFGIELGVNINKKSGVLSAETSPSPITTASLAPQIQASDSQLYKVSKVVDGDTIDVLIDGKSRAVRLIGVDTPETVDPKKPIECFGKEASDHAKSVLTGESVYLELDQSQGDLDKYKRLLRYVILEDGTNFNLSEISLGFAHEYTYDTAYKYQSEFKAAQADAMQKGLGLWSPSTCNGNTGTSSTQDILSPSSSPQDNIKTADYKPTGTYACDCSKQCGAIKTCDEAYYQLQNCGCSARDSDGDGIPCESLCQ